MGSSSKTIIWFRRDLRIEDNPALAAAARDGSVLPVYIWCPGEEKQFYPGRVSRWWLKQSLAHLDQSLRSLGASLVLIKAESTFAALLQCIDAVGATKVVYNNLYDPISLARDHDVKQKLVECGISVQSFNGDLLYEPWEVHDEKGQAFTTFNEYWDKCLHEPFESALLLPPWRLVPPAGIIESCSIEELGLEDESEKSSNALLGRGWSPGWMSADKALNEFVDRHLLNYYINRQKVEGTSTSLLSPHLHFGELSVRKVFQCARLKQICWAKEGNSDGEESVRHFHRAIGLREYSRYLCFNFPFTHERSLLGSLRYFPWRADQENFKAWRQGRTGYPLVDAGMRELWATGWLHNRIRVIVSSFFVKFLLLPWTWGMKYFWDTLLDADLENDILGWQYISGSLPDGHELNRLDSPEVQGCKYDPEGEYVRRWVPELARIPTEWIHHPWDAPRTVLRAAGVDLGLNYPMPIIKIDFARERLSDAISMMWESKAAARTTMSNGTNEVVVDNSDAIENLEIPRIMLKERISCSTNSSHDQRVPSIQNLKNGPSERKRSKCWEAEESLHDNLQSVINQSDMSRTIEDLCSTAESSAKKRSTSENQSSVSHFYSTLLKRESLDEHELPASSRPLHEQFDLEEASSKEGGTGI
ncbi:cryptochrome-1-like isoform X2 [Telopea speciosissima]|uniref:cryptochrome-1-like isoform X2 n=1 Tax=Telopea speciosissima TaxID=54955 RepID=UPI001CC5E581|nr:cryptochrome-1-like isoform X2 [Telopea speciosissima]